jgi:hypothetical protein
MTDVVFTPGPPVLVPTGPLGTQGLKGDPGSPGEGYASRALMAARASPTVFDDVYLTEKGREGKFIVDLASDWTAEIAADTAEQGRFVLSTYNPALVYRRVVTGRNVSTWWGVSVLNTAAQNVTAFRAALTALAVIAPDPGYSYHAGNAPLYTPAGLYLFDDELKPEFAVEIYGDSVILGGGTVFKWTGSSGHGLNIGGYDGSSVHGTGSSLRNITLVGWYAAPSDRAARHGIYANGQVHIENVFGRSWPGNFVEAFADPDSTSGNIDLSTFDNIYAELCDLTLQLHGGGSQACKISHIQGQVNRLGSYWDRSFLGNICIAPYAENCGLDTNFRSRCEKNGHVYVVALGQEVWCSTNSPTGTATHNQGWLYLGEGPTNFYTDTWVTGRTWYFTAPHMVYSGGSNRGSISGAYVEGGMNPIILDVAAACTTTTVADVWSPGGFRHGGYTYGNGSQMGFNGGIFVRGRNNLIGDTHEIGPVSGAATDLLFNLNSTNSESIGFNRYNSDGTLAASDAGISAVFGSLYIGAAGAINLRYGGVNLVSTASDGFKPATDNTLKLGDASVRWSTVYAGTGTINTSDARLKRVLQIDDQLLDAWAEVEWSAYQWKDAIEAKGENKARIHVGLIAQQVKAALDKRGIDGFRYGVLCYDEWQHIFEPEFSEETYTHEAMVEIARPLRDREKHKTHAAYVKSLSPEERAGFKTVSSPATRLVPKIDLKGKPVMKMKRRAGNGFGIRYDEAMALEAAFQRRRADRVETRLKTLEATVERLAAH